MTKAQQRRTDFHLVAALVFAGIVLFCLWTLFGCVPETCLADAPTAGSRCQSVEQLRDILQDAGLTKPAPSNKGAQ